MLRKSLHCSVRPCNIVTCLQRNELICKLRDVERHFIRTECDKDDDDEDDNNNNNNFDDNSDGYGVAVMMMMKRPVIQHHNLQTQAEVEIQPHA
jgi:hypothetical protein